MHGWTLFEHEAKAAFVGKGRFPIPAYSEYMPPPYVGIKPYAPSRSAGACTARALDDGALEITEYEQVEELRPGLLRIATLLLNEVAKLARGGSHLFSRTLLEGNPAWPKVLAEAFTQPAFQKKGFSLALALALSRTQDDKGNVRWTLFGSSHEGSSRPFWASFSADDEDRFRRVVAWMAGQDVDAGGLRVFLGPSFAGSGATLPAYAEKLRLANDASLEGVHVLLTFEPFATLPDRIQRAYLDRKLRLLPSPGTLAFFEHRGYASLADKLPLAKQIPLLHLFPRIEGGYAVRIPQSGWLDEHETAPGGFAGGHRVVPGFVRTHRWQRVERDQAPSTDLSFADKVSVALFSTTPDDVGLYGKPMARNAQIWTTDYRLLLDGPRADRAKIETAARALHTDGRFGYRIYYPPMRAGTRELFWHLPLIARLRPGAHQPEILEDGAPFGYVTAEGAGKERTVLAAKLLDRPLHRGAATLFPRDPGHARNTQSHNVHKVLDFAEMLGGKLEASFVRALVQAPKHATLDDGLARLLEVCQRPDEARKVIDALRAIVIPDAISETSLTFEQTATRDYEERLFGTIASLSEGGYRSKENADPIPGNNGKTGGAAARLAKIAATEQSDLRELGDHLHELHEATIARHGMKGRADVLDHVFRWETDFEFPWSLGWAKSQAGEGGERNIVVRIPGKRRDEAVIMADHYDTAYMEDVYEADRGGDGLRMAAHGADDNASGTTALLLAAEVLLPLARDGKLERDVWLVHLTGEEFPSDCLGARALASALIEKSLVLTSSSTRVDVSDVRITGVVVLDMVAHNNLRDKDTFLLCPGEGADSARLAFRAHDANRRWNRHAAKANEAQGRVGKGRAKRMESGQTPPPLFEHLPVFGKVAAEWEPRSVLYNTDGQIFSDVGVPVVLFMENYDINRTGYHDTQDTMKNIDLDYASALTRIAIETVASAALSVEPAR
jgi:Peptidase family M28